MNTYSYALIGTFILFCSSAFGQQQGNYRIGYTEQGKASYYADRLHGNSTANGEVYDKNAMTTAHPFLPFNTVIKITSKPTGKSVVLRVNDRCSPHKGRILDVSRVAAEQLDMIRPGVLDVTLEILNFDGQMPANNFSPTSPGTSNSSSANVNQAFKEPIFVSSPEQNPTITKSPNEVGFKQRGQATYYPGDRNNEVTVNGEPYLMGKLTAGHLQIPFNSLILVTNLDNGRHVTVRINDRTTTEGVILDLTLAAAEELGITGQLRADVSLEVVAVDAIPASRPTFLPPAREPAPTPEPIPQPQPTPEPEEVKEPDAKLPPEEAILSVGTFNADGEKVQPTGYGIQVGAYAKPDQAISLAREYESYQFSKIFIQSGWENGKRSIRVLVGSFPDENSANGTLKLIKGTNKNAFLRPHFKTGTNN